MPFDVNSMGLLMPALRAWMPWCLLRRCGCRRRRNGLLATLSCACQPAAACKLAALGAVRSLTCNICSPGCCCCCRRRAPLPADLKAADLNRTIAVDHPQMCLPRPRPLCTFCLQKFQAAAAGDRKAVLAEAEKVAEGVSGAFLACKNCRLLAALACYLCWCSQWTARASPAQSCARTDGLGLPHALAASCRTPRAAPSRAAPFPLLVLTFVCCSCIFLPLFLLHAEDDKENAALYVRFMKKAVEKVGGLLLVAPVCAAAPLLPACAHFHFVAPCHVAACVELPRFQLLSALFIRSLPQGEEYIAKELARLEKMAAKPMSGG